MTNIKEKKRKRAEVTSVRGRPGSVMGTAETIPHLLWSLHGIFVLQAIGTIWCITGSGKSQLWSSNMPFGMSSGKVIS